MRTIIPTRTYTVLLLVVTTAPPGYTVESRWPVRILRASDAAEFPYNGFGGSVAIDGDFAVIGAGSDPERRGAVYVFTRWGTEWIELEKLFGCAGTDGGFGTAVAIDGDRFVVGAPFHVDLGTGPGAAYIFRRDDGGTPADRRDDRWVEEARVTSPNSVAHEAFGESVAISGDVIVVGRPWCCLIAPGGDMGTAHVFRRNGTEWFHEAELHGAESEVSDRFGDSVAISQARILIGAPSRDQGPTQYGTVYAFAFQNGAWVEEARPAPDSAYYRIGESVSIDVDQACVGFVSADSVPLLRLGTSGWLEDATFVGEGATYNDRYGYPLVVRGDTSAIGATRDSEVGRYAGAVYLFRRSGLGWGQIAKLLPTSSSCQFEFGASLSLDDSHLLVRDCEAAWLINISETRRNLRDLSRLQSCFTGVDALGVTGCDELDADGDDRVDLVDYDVLLRDLVGP